MTCKPIFQFLKENGIPPTPENKKRWQAGWTLRELREGKEFIRENYEINVGMETEISTIKKSPSG